MIVERATISYFKTHKTDLLSTIQSTMLSVCFVLTCSLLLVISFVDFKMVSSQKKRQNKRFLSQLNEFDTDFMIGQNNHENQLDNRTNTDETKTTLNNTNNQVQVNGPQLDMHTLEKNIVDKVRSEVGSVMKTVETRVKYAVLTAIEGLVAPKVKLVRKSVNASSGQDADNLVLDPDPRVF